MYNKIILILAYIVTMKEAHNTTREKCQSKDSLITLDYHYAPVCNSL